MGKSLVIKGGNFQSNAIPGVSEWNEITENMSRSGTKRQYIHYPQNSPASNDMFQYSNSIETSRIYSINVSSYVGKRIKVFWQQRRPASNYTGGAWWRCFASALASGISLPWTGTSNVDNAITAVERISGETPTGTTMGTETKIYTVPQGAVYLIFSNNTTICETPRVWVEGD